MVSTASGAPLTLDQLDTVLDACPEGFLAVDRELRVVRWNAAAQALLGWAQDEVLGRRDPSVLPEERSEVEDRLGEFMAGTTPPRVEAGVRRHRDGRPIEVTLTGAVVLGPPGEPDGLGVYFRGARTDELRMVQRNRLSGRLVEAVREEDVLAVVRTSLRELLLAERGVVLTPCPEAAHLHGTRAVGGYQEEAEQVQLDLAGAPPDAPWIAARDGAVGRGTLSTGAHRDAPSLFVPMGPDADGAVLALVYPGGVPDDPGLPQLAQAVADETWIALQRANLVTELEGKVEMLEATAAVASSAGLDLQRTADAVVRHAATALSCERAAVYLREPDGTLRLASLFASDLDLATDAGDRVAREVLQRGRAVLVQDAGTCDFLEGPWHREQGAVSVFGLPLHVAGRDVGVLVVAHTVVHPRGFTNLCQQVGGAVAQQAALAIEHARLFGQQEASVRQLRELDALKADYVAGITHDLKTPLTGLIGFVKTLRRLDDTVDPGDRRRYLAIMERQALRLVDMVEDLLLAARIDARGIAEPTDLRRVTLASLLTGAVELYGPEDRERIVIEVVGHGPVEGDHHQLERVLHNLIDNAMKYAPAGSTVDVVLREHGDEVVVEVRDHGSGITPGERERIFDRYDRGSSGDQQGSTGLGLYISRGIARGHGGELAAVDGTGGGCFQLRLPRAG